MARPRSDVVLDLSPLPPPFASCFFPAKAGAEAPAIIATIKAIEIKRTIESFSISVLPSCRLRQPPGRHRPYFPYRTQEGGAHARKPATSAGRQSRRVKTGKCNKYQARGDAIAVGKKSLKLTACEFDFRVNPNASLRRALMAESPGNSQIKAISLNIDAIVSCFLIIAVLGQPQFAASGVVSDISERISIWRRSPHRIERETCIEQEHYRRGSGALLRDDVDRFGA
jgi:hypothetical protein